MASNKDNEKALTKKQQMVLDFVNEQVQEKGYPPSVREICTAVGFKSTSSAHAYLAKLEEMGLIQKDPSKPRAIKVLKTNLDDSHSEEISNFSDINNNIDNKDNIINFPGSNPDNVVDVPIVGKVTAGAPILAVENIEDTFPVPLGFVGNKESFMLKVRGESMINAGILNDDFVLVSKQSTASNGDIVVALIEDEATVKTFYKEKDHVRLQPQNELYDPIIVKDNFSILGKVIGVFRKL